MQRRDVGEGSQRARHFPAAPSAAASAPTSVWRGIEIGIAQCWCADRSDAARSARGGGTSQVPREASPARAQTGGARLAAAARAGSRVPAWRLRAHARSDAAPSRNSGCLSSASSVTGASPPSAASAASRANMPAAGVGERVAAGIVDRHVPARERRQHAARQRAVGRDQRGGLVRACSTASRSATAMASASSSALAASITATFASAGVARRSPSSQALPPAIGRAARAAALRRRSARGREARRRQARATSSRAMPMRRSSACMANCGWPKAGASRRRVPPISSRRRRRDRYRAPAAPRRRAAACDGREQLGGRRHRAGRARGDHRAAVRARAAARFRLDQQVAPRRRLDRAALGEMAGQCSRAILQEFERELPVVVVLLGHELVEPVPRHRRVIMSSIRRARSSASASAAAGDCARPATSRRAVGSSCSAHLSTAARAACGVRGRRARPAARAPRRRAGRMSANTISSSSMSPSGTMRGRIAASLSSASRKTSRASRQARRVGR